MELTPYEQFLKETLEEKKKQLELLNQQLPNANPIRKRLLKRQIGEMIHDIELMSKDLGKYVEGLKWLREPSKERDEKAEHLKPVPTEAIPKPAAPSTPAPRAGGPLPAPTTPVARPVVASSTAVGQPTPTTTEAPRIPSPTTIQKAFAPSSQPAATTPPSGQPSLQTQGSSFQPSSGPPKPTETNVPSPPSPKPQTAEKTTEEKIDSGQETASTTEHSS